MTQNKLINALFGLLCLAICYQLVARSNANLVRNLTASQVNKVNQLMLESAQTIFKNRPLDATVFGISELESGGKYSHMLGQYSPSVEAKLRQDMRRINQQLSSIKVQDKNVSAHQAVVQDINTYYSGYAGFDVGYIDMWHGLSPFIVNQISGPMVFEPNAMISNHQINNIEDALNYLSRMSQFERMVEGLIDKVNADANQQWVPPKAIISRTISSLEAFIAPEPSAHSLFTHFSTQVNALTESNDSRKQQLIQQASEFIGQHIYPAYERMITLQKELLNKGRNAAGIWAQPNGAFFYQQAINRLAETTLDAEAIHQLGLKEVSRITAEMDGILTTLKLTKGSVSERMNQLMTADEFQYPNNPLGKQDLLNDLNQYISDAEIKMPKLFSSAPPFAVEVRAFPSERETFAPGGMYTSPSLDGKQPGIYWINLYDMSVLPKFDLKTLTFHETIPGHHWQIAHNLGQDDFPVLRKLAPYNAFIEGWALYAERLAYEIGFYHNDPHGNLGRLKAELFRSARLVVDTGIHYKKWTREQAIDYMVSTTGNPISTVTTEVERYMVWPAQALGYKMGMQGFLQLRAEAQKTLGEAFDIKEFHDQILLNGAVRMDLLRTQIKRWAKRKQLESLRTQNYYKKWQ